MRAPGVVCWGLALALVVVWTGNPALAKTELEFWHGQGGDTGQRLGELAERFNASQADYEVKPLYNRAGGSVLPAVIAAYRAKRPPHLALLSDSATEIMLRSGAAVPVARLMREQGGALEGGSFLEPVKACYLKDNQLHAFPLAPSSHVLYYNKDVFRRAGLDPSRAPSTFDEIEAAATRVVAAGAAKCGFTSGSPAVVLEIVHAWHGQPLADREDGAAGLSTTLLFNGELGIRFWDTLIRWQRAGLYVYGGRARQAELLFTGGQCAMVIGGGSLNSSLELRKIDWGVGPVPRFAGYPRGGSIVGGSALWVLEGHGPAEYRGVARFLEFTARVDQQAWWYRATGYLPASHEVLRRLQTEGWFARHPSHAATLTQISGGEGQGVGRCFRVGNLGAIRDTIEVEFEAVLSGRKTAKAGLDDAVRRGNELLKDFADSYR